MTEMAHAEQAVVKQGANDQLTMELERLSELLNHLDSVLAPALRPPSPQEVGANMVVDSSPLRDGVYKFRDLNSRLSSLIERIDL